jgi:hypothetical protein
VVGPGPAAQPGQQPGRGGRHPAHPLQHGETETAEEADAVGERAVLDLDDTDTSEFLDVAPGGQEGENSPTADAQRLLRYARRAEDLFGPKQDAKLKQAIALVKRLLQDGYNPILFCRFIPTAEYVAAQLRQALPNKVEVTAVTGICRRPSGKSGWSSWASMNSGCWWPPTA